MTKQSYRTHLFQHKKKDAKIDKKDNTKQNVQDEKIKIKQPTMIEDEEKSLTKENKEKEQQK